MNPSDIRRGVLDALLAIAPEVDARSLDDTRALRDQVDLDSMDWVNLLLGLHSQFGIDIPGADHARLATLRQIVGYVAARAR